ncbi:MAG: hypothetical protein ABII12_13480 [Planctomycetota bacterium]
MRFAVYITGVAGFAGLLLLQSGCGPGKAYDRASVAEKRGEIDKAYDDYCRAARRNPGNGSVQSGIKRTGPVASARYQSQALSAMEEDRYVDAWKLLMRAIEISPNNPSAVFLVRKLEKEHGVEIADARAAWRRQGSLALKIDTPQGSLARQEATVPPAFEEDGVRFARAAGPSEDSVKSWLASLPKSDPRDIDEPPLEGDSRPLDDASEEGAVAEPRIAAAPPVETRPEVRARALTGGGNSLQGRPTGRAAPRHVVHPADSMQASHQSDEVGAGGRQASRREPSRQRDDLFVLRTLSKENRRFTRRALLVDGIVANLKDTDDDLDADIDLYDGDQRIKKIRSLEIGQSKTFRGRSGKLYDLTILSIHHKSHTVRLGVKPTPEHGAEDA